MNRQDTPQQPRSDRSAGLFAHLSRAQGGRHGLACITAAGALWAGLSWLLASRGHAPSRAFGPIARDHYYAAQAVFVLPLLWLQWRLCARVAHGVARWLGGAGTLAATANALGVALGAPLIVVFLLPDLLTFLLFGFSALGTVIRVSAPVSFLTTLWLASAALRASHRLPRAKALLAGGAGVLAQALLGAVLLR